MPILEADSVCDLINNRAFCQYDGGDCNNNSNDTSMYIVIAPTETYFLWTTKILN